MINYDEFDTEDMDDLGKASVNFVQEKMQDCFSHIFGDHTTDEEIGDPYAPSSGCRMVRGRLRDRSLSFIDCRTY